MRLRQAAVMGRILVVIHLALNLAVLFFFLAISGARHNEDLQTLIYIAMIIVATVALDVALLLVFSSLARTTERQLYDSSDNTASQAP